MTRQASALTTLALAAITTLGALPAAAQNAPGTSVTVYGLIDGCLASADLGSERLNAVSSGCLYGSRLGFRGTEDLGGGLQAAFTLESGITIDNGQLAQGGRMFGRKALVSLSGPWGTVEAGRDYAPAFYLVQPIDPMALGIGTASSSLWTGAASTTSARNDNAVNYLSPTWGGVSLRLQATAGEGGAGGARKSQGLNLLYRSGGTLAGLSYARVGDVADDQHDSAFTLGVKQELGRFSVAALAQSGAWEASRTAAAPASTSSVFSRKYRSWLVGGSVRTGSVGKLSLSIKRYDDRTVRNFDFTQVSVNYVHALSKRTDLYAGWSRLGNNSRTSYTVSDATGAYGPVQAGASTSLLAAGIKHVF